MSFSSADGFVLTTLVTGPSAQARENAIARLFQEEQVETACAAAAASAASPSDVLIVPTASTAAILLEGLPASRPVLPSGPAIQCVRIAPGCICCSGNLVMQVTLNRLLRTRPRRLFIALASTAHLTAIQGFLTCSPYDTLLRLTPLVTA